MALPVHAKKEEDKNKGTIFEILERTDGSQALVAAIRYVDAASGCDGSIEQLLDDKKESGFLCAKQPRVREVPRAS